MKKILNYIVVSIFFVIFIVAAAGCAQSNDFSWNLKQFNEQVSFHTDLQREYLNDNYLTVSNYASGNKELSKPKAVVLEWELFENGNMVENVAYYVLSVSEYDTLRYATQYETTEKSYDVYNLKIATRYYWRVEAYFADGKCVRSQTVDFQTADEKIRNLNIDGITNVRDVGGWDIRNGRVKQGMLFRCGRLNKSGSSTVKIEITDQGKYDMINVLGIRTEIDLRNVENNEVGSITESPLGNTVSYYQFPLDWSVPDLLMGNAEVVKRIFDLLGDESRYPMIFHCDIGTDRTGMIAYLINGLLGVGEDDLYRDYLFSNFGKIGGNRTLAYIVNNYVATIKATEGDNLGEKIENCLLGIGVSQDTIDTVRKIMTA